MAVTGGIAEKHRRVVDSKGNVHNAEKDNKKESNVHGSNNASVKEERKLKLLPRSSTAGVRLITDTHHGIRIRVLSSDTTSSRRITQRRDCLHRGKAKLKKGRKPAKKKKLFANKVCLI